MSKSEEKKAILEKLRKDCEVIKKILEKNGKEYKELPRKK